RWRVDGPRSASVEVVNERLFAKARDHDAGKIEVTNGARKADRISGRDVRDRRLARWPTLRRGGLDPTHESARRRRVQTSYVRGGRRALARCEVDVYEGTCVGDVPNLVALDRVRPRQNRDRASVLPGE